jgi:hypothetical protein
MRGSDGRSRRHFAAVGAAVLIGTVATGTLAACGDSKDNSKASSASASKANSTAVATPPPFKLGTRYYEELVTQIYTPPGGKPTTEGIGGPPVAGSRLELLGKVYEGDAAKHGTNYVGTDHTICVFDAKLTTHCDAQVAFDDSMLLASSVSGGEGDIVAPVTGGTGRFAGAKGTVRNHSLGETNNSELTFDVNLP